MCVQVKILQSQSGIPEMHGFDFARVFVVPFPIEEIPGLIPVLYRSSPGGGFRIIGVFPFSFVLVHCATPLTPLSAPPSQLVDLGFALGRLLAPKDGWF